MMSLVGVHKLNVKYFETTDPFLVNEFITNRIKQLPFTNSNDSLFRQFRIKVENKICQEMCVYSDHIEVQLGENKWAPANKHFDSFMLFKLGIGKSVHIVMQPELQSAESDDKHRAC